MSEPSSNENGSEVLDGDFARDDRLFHYTSSAGLYGILDSGCLWATHFRFLNDSREIYSARASLRKYIGSKILSRVAAMKVNKQIRIDSDISLRDLCDEESERLVDVFYNAAFGDDLIGATTSDAFVFSAYCCGGAAGRKFTDGTLYHWATYGKTGGYAIIFEPRKLRRLLDAEGQRLGGAPYFFGKAVYVESDEVPVGLEEDYECIGNAAQELTESLLLKNTAEADLSRAGAAFFKVAIGIKDQYFADEAEARAVVVRPKNKSSEFDRHDMLFRTVGAVSIPYIKLFDGKLLGEESPIEGIIIGPHPDNLRRKIALKAYLRERGLDRVVVTESAIPYVTIAAS